MNINESSENTMVCDTPYLQNELDYQTFFYLFDISWSLSNCSQRLKEICTMYVRRFWARTFLIMYSLSACALRLQVNWPSVSECGRAISDYWKTIFSIYRCKPTFYIKMCKLPPKRNNTVEIPLDGELADKVTFWVLFILFQPESIG